MISEFAANIAPNIGFAALMLGASISLLIFALVFFYQKKIPCLELQKIVEILSKVEFAAFAVAQLALIYSFIISDYSVKNVFENSHHLKPLLFKISAAWGNHEGSMLLLLLVLSGYGLLYLNLNFSKSNQRQLTLAVQNLIIFLFCAYCIKTSNPFLRLNYTPQSGLGLNPILQDIGLSLHPPMLYLGYLGFSLVFSHIIACLLQEDFRQVFDNDSLKLARILLSLTLGFLTAGIALGSWWAYRELGWGGYWFWDPVENVSLMPWIAGIALLHSLKASSKNIKMLVWSLFLTIATMILCLLGIFLTRSGVLSSVHSFAVDNSKAIAMLLIIFIVGSLGLLLLSLKLPKILQQNYETTSKEISKKSGKFSWLIIANNYLLLVSLLIVLIGTLYSPIALGLFGQSVAIGSDYYNQVFSWLILPILLFLILASNPSCSSFNKKNLWLFFASLILTFSLISICESELENHQIFSFSNFSQKTEIWIKFTAIFLAIWSVVLSLYQLWLKAWNFIYKEAEETEKDYSSLLKKISSPLGHLGFAVLITGILLNSTYSQSKEINLQTNQSFRISGIGFNFLGIDYKKGANFIARQGIFEIRDGEKILGKINPELRYYPIGDKTTNESAILHRFFAKPFGDIYLVIGNKDEDNNYAVRAFIKPFMFLIWLGSILIFLSLTLLSLGLAAKSYSTNKPKIL